MNTLLSASLDTNIFDAVHFASKQCLKILKAEWNNKEK